jgi:hypothetical protein
LGFEDLGALPLPLPQLLAGLWLWCATTPKTQKPQMQKPQ